MESVIRFLQLLGIIKDRRLKEIQNGPSNCATCSPAELQAWQDFIAYIDLLAASPDYPARKILIELFEKPSRNLGERLAFFHKLLLSRNDWADVLRFAELPIQFVQDTFEQLNAAFAKAKSFSDQTALIANRFTAADPTHIEMLFLLVEGSIERQPQPQTKQAGELVEREKAVRMRLKELLSGDMSDELRWWLIRTINSATGPAQAFLKETVKNRRDLRLQCMLLPMLLKTGFEWAEKFGTQATEEIESMQSHMYASRVSRLIELVEPA